MAGSHLRPLRCLRRPLRNAGSRGPRLMHAQLWQRELQCPMLLLRRNRCLLLGLRSRLCLGHNTRLLLCRLGCCHWCSKLLHSRLGCCRLLRRLNGMRCRLLCSLLHHRLLGMLLLLQGRLLALLLALLLRSLQRLGGLSGHLHFDAAAAQVAPHARARPLLAQWRRKRGHHSGVHLVELRLRDAGACRAGRQSKAAGERRWERGGSTCSAVLLCSSDARHTSATGLTLLMWGSHSHEALQRLDVSGGAAAAAARAADGGLRREGGASGDGLRLRSPCRASPAHPRPARCQPA